MKREDLISTMLLDVSGKATGDIGFVGKEGLGKIFLLGLLASNTCPNPPRATRFDNDMEEQDKS